MSGSDSGHSGHVTHGSLTPWCLQSDLDIHHILHTALISSQYKNLLIKLEDDEAEEAPPHVLEVAMMYTSLA